MSFFRSKAGKQRLEEYMGGGAIEKIESKTLMEEESPTPALDTAIEETPTLTEIQEESVVASVVEGFVDTAMSESEEQTSAIVSINEETIAADVEETFVSETPLEKTEEVPSLPEAREQLSEDRKEEFLGLSEEEKQNAEKEKDQGLNDANNSELN